LLRFDKFCLDLCQVLKQFSIFSNVGLIKPKHIKLMCMIPKSNHPRFNFAIMYVALKFSRFGVGQQWLGVRVVLIV
jgi:hypothetical protein